MPFLPKEATFAFRNFARKFCFRYWVVAGFLAERSYKIAYQFCIPAFAVIEETYFPKSCGAALPEDMSFDISITNISICDIFFPGLSGMFFIICSHHWAAFCVFCLTPDPSQYFQAKWAGVDMSIFSAPRSYYFSASS